MITPRLQYLDSLRGLAIIGVITTHVGSKTLTDGTTIASFLRKVADLGGMGVPLFYMVSAFTIAMLYSRRVSSEPAPIRSFYIRRLIRIVPMYWLGIAIYTAVYGIHESRGWLDSPETWHYPLHFLLLNMTNPFTPSTVVPGGWSISNEVIFYLVFPLLFLLARSARSAGIIFLASIALSPEINRISEQLVATVFTQASDEQARQFSYRWLPNQLSCFTAGIFLFHLHNSKILDSWMRRGSVILGLRVMALIIPALIVLVGNGPFHYNHLWIFFFIVLAISMNTGNWVLVDSIPMAWIGKISYSSYLIHFLVIDFLVRSIPDFGSVRNFFLLISLAMPITFALSWISYKHLESRTHLVARKLVDRLHSSSVMPSQGN